MGSSEIESDDLLKVVPDSPLSFNEMVEDSQPSNSINEKIVQDSQPSNSINEKIVQDSQPSNSINEKIVENSQPSSPTNEKIVQDSQPSISINGQIAQDSQPSISINEKIAQDSQPSSPINEQIAQDSLMPTPINNPINDPINEVVEDSQNSSPMSKTVENSSEIAEDSEASSSSDFGSQRTNERSEMHGLTWSMMQFLLPQAVPLLPKRERRSERKRFKKKRRNSCNENDQMIEDDGMKAAELKIEATDQESKELKTLNETAKLNPEHFYTSECVIADSFEDDNSDQKIGSPILSVNARNFEDNSNEKLIDCPISNPIAKEGASLQNELCRISNPVANVGAILQNELCPISNLVAKEGAILQNDLSTISNIVAKEGAVLQNELCRISNPVVEEGAILQNDLSPISNPVMKEGAILQNDLYPISNPVTKEGAILQNEGAILQNDLGELSDSFLAGLEEEIRAIEMDAILKKTNLDPSRNSEIPKGTFCVDKQFNKLGPFQHSEPVLSLALSSKDDNCIEICVLCGELNTRERSLYVYNLVFGQPRFVGYTSMFIDSSSNQNLALKGGWLQYISEGRLLALIPSIKTPYCRKMCINCGCSICKQEQVEENCVKLVRVDLGFVVPVTKLKSNEKISSLLVCKPNYVVAIERTRLHVWMMSSTWRAVLDEFILSTLENVVELERVPESNALILGHDSFGSFFLWDISKRVLLAKFQSPNSRISKMIPLSCFNINKTEFCKIEKNKKLCIRDGENCLAVWMLIECQTGFKNKRWRLALLAKNSLFTGLALDPRISALDASANFGFVGTLDGFFYKWDLYSGRKVAWMDCFYSGSVSCIAADPKSGVVAVADDNNQVLICTEQN